MTKRIAVALLGLALAELVSAVPEPCGDGSSGETGYSTIASLNSDIAAEQARISQGGTPAAEYTFVLCPNTVLDASAEPLKPLLSNSFFLCGRDGSSSNSCTIDGGPTQVEIVDSSISSYPLADLTFSGIQFSAFTTESISATATFPTTANFQDVIWTNFASNFVVRQATGQSTGSMVVNVQTSAVSSGTSGVVFDNNAGSIQISGLVVNEVDAASLIATANGGSAFIEDSSITASAFDQVTMTSSLGAQSVMGVTVSEMRRLVDAFKVTGAGSQLIMSGTSITNNDLDGEVWTGVLADMAGSAEVLGLTMTNNKGVEFAVSAVGSGSVLVMRDSTVERNTGVTQSNRISASVIALLQATVTLARVQFVSNVGFTASAIALRTGTLSLTQSCMEDGEATYVVFVDPTSTFNSDLNYVNAFKSVECPDGGRLFQEDQGSGCFLGSNVCEGTCVDFADQTECLAELVPTQAPIPGQTRRPTVAPVTAEPTLGNEPTTSPVAVTNAPTAVDSNLSPAPTRLEPMPLATPSPTRKSTFPPSDCPTPGKGKSKGGKKGSKKKGPKGKGGKSKKGSSGKKHCPKSKGKGKGYHIPPKMPKGNGYGHSQGKGYLESLFGGNYRQRTRRRRRLDRVNSIRVVRAAAADLL